MEIHRVGMSAGNRSKHTVIMSNGEANSQQHVLLHAPPDLSTCSAGNNAQLHRRNGHSGVDGDWIICDRALVVAANEDDVQIQAHTHNEFKM